MATEPRRLRCSFCLKAEEEVARIIAGPGSYVCDECVALCVRILAADSPPPTNEPDLPRWASLTDEQVLERLPKLAEIRDQVESALDLWVGEARRRKVPWSRIGAALAMTRQSAWERFSHDI